MAEQLFQIAIKALIRNGKGDILMLHVPAWSNNEAHWDLPGGRMEAEEKPLETLKRELQEEIGQSYIGKPHQLMTFLTNISIPVGDVRIPLIFVVYEVFIDKENNIQLDLSSNEDEYMWLSKDDAADAMVYKFSEDFCNLVRTL